MSSLVITVVPETTPLDPSAHGGIEPYFRAHYTRLVRALALAYGDTDAAADAVQEAFARAHARWRTLQHYDDPVGWVRRVALNLLHDEHRRDVRKRRAIDRLAAEPAAVEPTDEPGGLADLLDALPRQQRIAVSLFYVEGLAVAEVAEAMGLATGSVKSHLHDARRRLRAQLEEGA